MGRSIWRGSLSFGLVNIPVSLQTAERSEELHFHLLDRRDQAPIHYQRINARTGKEVPWDETVRAFELDDGRYVVLTDKDFERANPESTRTVEILDFVERAEIDPRYFDKPYYLAPERQGAKSYALLCEALARSGRVGIAKVVIHTRQHLAAVIPVGEVIVLNLMRFADELRDAAELDIAAGRQGAGDKELKMALQLVEAMAETWSPERYRDDYRVDVMALIDKRAAAGELAGGKTAPARRRPAGGKVVDLMALLKQSVEQGGGRRDRRSTAGRGAAVNQGAALKRAARIVR
jgi:DNA end-binding protein Ku